MIRNASATACLLALLAGCAAQGPVDPRVSTYQACISFTATMKTLKGLDNAGKLPVGTREQVLQAYEVATPICTAADPVTGDATTLEGINAQLEAIVLGSGGK